jgi:hypothetical protein
MKTQSKLYRKGFVEVAVESRLSGLKDKKSSDVYGFAA